MDQPCMAQLCMDLPCMDLPCNGPALHGPAPAWPCPAWTCPAWTSPAWTCPAMDGPCVNQPCMGLPCVDLPCMDPGTFQLQRSPRQHDNVMVFVSIHAFNDTVASIGVVTIFTMTMSNVSVFYCAFILVNLHCLMYPLLWTVTPIYCDCRN